MAAVSVPISALHYHNQQPQPQSQPQSQLQAAARRTSGSEVGISIGVISIGVSSIRVNRVTWVRLLPSYHLQVKLKYSESSINYNKSRTTINQIFQRLLDLQSTSSTINQTIQRQRDYERCRRIPDVDLTWQEGGTKTPTINSPTPINIIVRLRVWFITQNILLHITTTNNQTLLSVLY